VFFGNLIKSAVSRQREYLADASSVQFTRNPSGIAGALAKIGGLTQGSRIANDHAAEASHMFFGNALATSWFGLLATHPPLLDRIKRIDPAFDGTFPAVEAVASRAAARPPGPRAHTAGVAGLAAAAAPRPARKISVDSSKVVRQVGTPQPQHRDYAVALRDAIPPQVLAEVRDPYGARTVIYGLLIDTQHEMRQKQLQRLDTVLDAPSIKAVMQLLPMLQALRPECRLPLIDLAVPALQQISPNQYADFQRTVTELVEADQQISLFEYTLQRIIRQNLDSRFASPKPRQVAYYSVAGVKLQCEQLLSTLAYAGQHAAGDAERAFRAGAAQLGLPAGAVGLLPEAEAGMNELDEALERLVLLSPPQKRKVIAACVDCIGADGSITVEEAELLRAVAASLDCPMPPLLADAA
jgi:hypothetical protein